MSAALPLQAPFPEPVLGPPRVSVVIKALNEERRIRGAIESALEAVGRVGGEVILADSGSSDRTVEIAREYPVTVVQLRNFGERRCGVGPQLGYQRARGEFVYILDGDMELDPGFLPAAIAAMDADSRLAGLAGVVEERSEASYQFRGRKRRGHERKPSNCEWLDMGGLYRAEALREVGYFSNRNLHAYEEMELGLRLCAAGWTLRRLEVAGVVHHGREEGNWPLLVRRWRSGYLDGAGELVRASLGRPYLYRTLQTQRHLFVALALWVGLVAGLALLPWSAWPLAGVGALLAALVLLRARRTGSLADAAFGQVVWQVTSLAMLRGLLRPPKDPREPVESVVLHAPPGARSTRVTGPSDVCRTTAQDSQEDREL